MITMHSHRDTRDARGAAGARSMRVVLLVVTVLALVVSNALPASAYWGAAGTGSATATTATLASPVGVAVPETATTNVAVSWTAGVTGGGVIGATGYYVTRTAGTTSGPACNSSPTKLIEPVECTDIAVSAGSYSYAVTAVFGSWTATSEASAFVTVEGERSILGAAAPYSVLAWTAVVSTDSTSVSGDVGVSPESDVRGFPPGIVGGDINADNSAAASAQGDLDAAFVALAAKTPTTELSGDLNGTTLPPGVVHSTAALALTGTLTLDAANDADAIFVIQVNAALNTAAASKVVLINGARASNVFWVVEGAAGIGANASFAGTILSRGAITVGAGAELIGRALSRGTVTLAGNTIRFTVAPPPTMTIDGGLTVTTKDSTPTLTGTSNAPDNSPIKVTVGGETLTTSLSNVGTWAVTASALNAGTYPVVAKVRDPSGNGSSAAQALTVEINPPTVDLGAATSYSVLAGVSVVNSANTALSGDLGVSPGNVVRGFRPGTLAGTIHAGDTAATTAQAHLFAALEDASARSSHTEFTGDLNGRTFHLGVHHTSAAISLTGTVTLDAEGDPDAVFIFQTNGALNTAAGSTVKLANGANASNIFWIVAGAGGTGAASSFSGNILARGAITLGDGTVMVGQALSRDTVTLANNTMSGVVGTKQ
jgi:hypothetical protein